MARQPETRVKFSIFNQEFNQGIAEIGKESTKLRKEFKLQQEQLKLNGTQTEKFEAKLTYLSKQYALTEQKVRDTSQQLAKAKTVYGENSEEARKLANQLLDYQIAQQKLENQISSSRNEQKKYKKSLQDVERLLEATETSAEDFANMVGPELAEAMARGKASTKQLEFAFRKLSREAVGSETDIHQVRQALSALDNGSSINSVRQDLNRLSRDADDARGSVRELGSEIGGLAGGIAAGVGVGEAITQSLDASTLKTKIDVSFNVPEESKKEIFEVVRNIEAYGIDAEAALEGVRKQWALNKDASDEVNASVVKGAGNIASSYSEIDFSELIQEMNEIGSALNISNLEALGLVNSLLEAGFPPGEIDIIAEYGTQLQRAGYDAEQIQNIFAAGVNTKSWNIDTLLDGIKEGRIQMADFGSGLNENLKDILAETDISAKQFQEWGKTIASGGEDGQVAMLEVTKALSSVKDETDRNQLGTKIFGTLWEEQGQKIIDTLLNAEKGTADLSKGVEELSQDTKKIDNSPMKQLSQAIQDLKIALDPLLSILANVVSNVADWVSNNPQLAATITAIVSVIGILLGICMALAPVFSILSGAASILGVAFGAIAWPVLAVVAAIAAAIAIGIALWKNWDTIKVMAAIAWESIKLAISIAVTAIIAILTVAWNVIKAITVGLFNGLKLYFTTVWNIYKTIFTVAVSTIKAVITTGWNVIKTLTVTIFNIVMTVIRTVWNGIKSTISSVVNGIKSTISSVWNGIKSITSSVFQSVKSSVTSIWNGIKNSITNPIQSAKDKVLGIISAIKSAFRNMKITIPKPKLPKVDISKGIKTIAGIDIPYPKFDVTWHKTGGVFTKPVVAGNSGFGDVEEGIVPFEGPHAMRIAKLIAEAQNRIKETSKNVVDKIINNLVEVNVEAGDIIMEGKSVGKIVWRSVKQEIDSFEARP
ncbi:replication protein [Rossellomorea arthrocnemi]